MLIIGIYGSTTIRGWRILQLGARERSRFQIYHRFTSNFSFPSQATINRYTPSLRIIGLGLKKAAAHARRVEGRQTNDW